MNSKSVNIDNVCFIPHNSNHSFRAQLLRCSVHSMFSVFFKVQSLRSNKKPSEFQWVKSKNRRKSFGCMKECGRKTKIQHSNGHSLTYDTVGWNSCLPFFSPTCFHFSVPTHNYGASKTHSHTRNSRNRVNKMIQQKKTEAESNQIKKLTSLSDFIHCFALLCQRMTEIKL